MDERARDAKAVWLSRDAVRDLRKAQAALGEGASLGIALVWVCGFAQTRRAVPRLTISGGQSRGLPVEIPPRPADFWGQIDFLRSLFPGLSVGAAVRGLFFDGWKRGARNATIQLRKQRRAAACRAVALGRRESI